MKLTGRFRGRETIKCPRCGEKCLTTQPICPDCVLVFSRLDECTNKAASIRLRHGEKHNVLMVKKVPSDKKFWKLLLYSSLLGLFGAHYFYVYRWKMGVYMLFSFFVAMFFGSFFNNVFITWPQSVQFIIISYVAIFALIWLYSVVQVILRKFKIPVSMPYKEFKVEDKK